MCIYLYRLNILRDLLQRRLFTANEVFQSVLLHVRTLCERASNSLDGSGIGNHEIIFIKFDTSITYSLEEFTKIQDDQINLGLFRLNLLKEEVMKLTYIACVVSRIFYLKKNTILCF